MSTSVLTQDTGVQIRQRCQRIPTREKAKLVRILRQLALGRRLADLHLFLPVADVCFYGLGEDMLQSAS